MTIDYGFDTTDNVQYDKVGLPVGTHKVMIVGEEEDPKGRGVIAEYEIVGDSDFKGKKGKVWYLTKHDDAQTVNIAKQNLKRIADATARPVTPTTPLKGRVLVIEVRQQKKNPDYTEIAKYWPDNHEIVNNDPPFN